MVDAVCWPGLSGEFRDDPDRRRNGYEIAGFDSLPVPLSGKQGRAALVPAVTTRAQRKGRIQSRLSPRIRQGPGHGTVAEMEDALTTPVAGEMGGGPVASLCRFEPCRPH